MAPMPKLAMSWSGIVVGLVAGFIACRPAPTGSVVSAEGDKNEPRMKLVSDEKHGRLMSLFPQTDDPWLKKLKHSGLMFYTDEELPPAYQRNSGTGRFGNQPDRQGFISTKENPAGSLDDFGQANKEFPWGHAAATDASEEIGTFKFMKLPKGERISYDQVKLPNPFSNHRASNMIWSFPEGTVVGEVLMVRDSDGTPYPFEVRVRQKRQTDWLANVYRPFRSPESLAGTIKDLVPDWQDQDSVRRFIAHLKSESAGEARSLRDYLPREALSRNSKAREVLKSEAVVDELPPLPEEVVKKVLTQAPFRSVRGRSWRGSADRKGFAPTTKEDFHIVPKDYMGAFLEVSSESCKGCHDTTLVHAQRFNTNREWYGRVRGSDKIFSFYPMAPDSVTRTLGRGGYSMNRDMVEADVAERGEVLPGSAPGLEANGDNDSPVPPMKSGEEVGGSSAEEDDAGVSDSSEAEERSSEGDETEDASGSEEDSAGGSADSAAESGDSGDDETVHFRIEDGTGRGNWNTRAEMITVKVGQTLRIHNDDRISHRLHTNGSPCPHSPRFGPGETYDCVIRQTYEPGNRPLYDHNTRGRFWLRATR